MHFKARRLSASLTQVEAAKLLGIRRTAVSMWESGKSSPRSDMLPKIATLYGCSIDDLLIGEKPTANQERQESLTIMTKINEER